MSDKLKMALDEELTDCRYKELPKEIATELALAAVHTKHPEAFTETSGDQVAKLLLG